MENQKTEQRLVEFSTSRIELVNDGSERQRQVYQLQNRSPSSLRVRAAIAKDSDPVKKIPTWSLYFYALFWHSFSW